MVDLQTDVFIYRATGGIIISISNKYINKNIVFTLKKIDHEIMIITRTIR